MSPSLADLSTLSRLLDEALDLEPAQVEAWLAALPEAHRHLLPQLREMLSEHLSPGHAGFMSAGAKLAGGAVDETVARAEDLVGPYRLIREIGRGGMGAVWLAERADGSLKRHVALKLPRLAWGAGLTERMARERDIGASLEHPNIARLYDAGVDASGRPYLALEYIDGQPLDTWCETKALGVPERLRLFLQVARAVAYAHGRLVVHRDLKPSNVLVTADGEAHLLDGGPGRRRRTGAGAQGGRCGRAGARRICAGNCRSSSFAGLSRAFTLNTSTTKSFTIGASMTKRIDTFAKRSSSRRWCGPAVLATRFATPTWRATAACRGASTRPRRCWRRCRTSVPCGGGPCRIP